MLVNSLDTYFVHIPKCAGTSIEEFFLKNDGINIDVNRNNKHNYRGIGLQLTTKQKLNYLHGGLDGRRFGSTLKNNVPAQHFTALQAKEYISNFDELFTFAVVRNPWDRFVSEYYWHKLRGRKLANTKTTFEQYIKNVKKELKLGRDGHYHILPQYMYTHDDNLEPLLNRIYYFENLSSLENDIIKKFNIKCNFKTLNTTTKTKDNYNQYYTKETYEMLGEMYKEDVKLFYNG
tara:strand:+ start:8789 stop:9487 length:699 start_codon:yes stop_codon:yes gene_type:complete